MLVVIFEAEPTSAHRAEYFERAEQLRPLVDDIDGFVSIERFESVTNPEHILSLSTWHDQESVARWRAAAAHVAAQQAGREHIFARYRIRVADVVRDKGFDRDQIEP